MPGFGEDSCWGIAVQAVTAVLMVCSSMDGKLFRLASTITEARLSSAASVTLIHHIKSQPVHGWRRIVRTNPRFWWVLPGSSRPRCPSIGPQYECSIMWISDYYKRSVIKMSSCWIGRCLARFVGISGTSTDQISRLLIVSVTKEPLIWTDTSPAGGLRQGEAYFFI